MVSFSAIIRRATLAVMLLVLAATERLAAQDPVRDFVPEIDVHVGVNEHTRFLFQAKDDREGGDHIQSSIGPSLQFYRKPLIKNLQRLILLDLDTTKSRLLMAETGYRVINAPDTPVKNRLIEAVTFRFPLMNEFALANRVRVDLDWQNGAFTWRFRDKLVLARPFKIRSYPIAPFVACEPFYTSKYGKFSSTDLYAGLAYPAGKHAAFDTYYEHENNTGKCPNSQKTYVGLVLHLFFRTKEKIKR